MYCVWKLFACAIPNIDVEFVRFRFAYAQFRVFDSRTDPVIFASHNFSDL